MALYAALTQYMLAHGLPVNAPAPAIALQQNLPPLDGFVGLVGLLEDVDDGPEHGPDVQEDEFADFGEPPEVDEIVWDAQVGQVDQVVEEVGDGPALLLQPVPLPEVEPVLQPALVPGHDHIPIPVPAQDAAVVAQDNAEDGAHMNQQEDAPPAYDAPHAAPVDNGEDVVEEPEHDPVVGVADLIGEHVPAPVREQMVQDIARSSNELMHDNQDVAPNGDDQALPAESPRTTEELAVPGPSNVSAGLDLHASLDMEGRAAMSSLCTRFGLPENSGSLDRALVEADHRIHHLERLLAMQSSRNRLHFDGEPASTSQRRPAEKDGKLHGIHKLRRAWKKVFPGAPSRDVI
ncbi:hypothetical protein PENSPDRAFT_377999 [Peniophora sp. CONT]|nr:hypothetical protein PENSPDRAFT_377999 [Peniophora sp. CONT]